MFERGGGFIKWDGLSVCRVGDGVSRWVGEWGLQKGRRVGRVIWWVAVAGGGCPFQHILNLSTGEPQYRSGLRGAQPLRCKCAAALEPPGYPHLWDGHLLALEVHDPLAIQVAQLAGHQAVQRPRHPAAVGGGEGRL